MPKVNLKKLLDWGPEGFVLLSTVGPMPRRAGCDCQHDASVTHVFETAVFTCDAIGVIPPRSLAEYVAHFETEESARAHHELMISTALTEGAKLYDVPFFPWNADASEVRA